MIYIVENFAAIAVATLASMLVTAAWDRGVVRGSALPVAVVAEGWMASILAGALILAPPEAGPWVMAIGTAIIVWIGFIVPAIVVDHRRRGVAWATTGRDSALWLAVLLVQTVVLSLWGLTPPTR